MTQQQELMAIEVENVIFSYKNLEKEVPILKNVSFCVPKGKMVAIQGPSGSGKSTLLYLLSGILSLQEGNIFIQNYNLAGISEEEGAFYRNKIIGLIFQQFHLLPKISVLENILLPSLYSKNSSSNKREREEIKEKAIALAKKVGIDHRLSYFPMQLSGGQQQRVAICRALLNNPEVILADEPTGNLDHHSSQEVLDLLKKLNREEGKTIVIITHDREVAEMCDEIFVMCDGQLESQERRKKEKENIYEKNTLRRKKISSPTSFSWQEILFSGLLFALDGLKKSKIRTFLSLIGIVVGIVSVLSLVTLGEYVKKQIISGYEDLGANVFTFYGDKNYFKKGSSKLKNLIFNGFSVEKDLIPLKKIFSQIDYWVPILEFQIDGILFGGKTYDGENRSRVNASNHFFSKIFKKEIVIGRNFNEDDIKFEKNFCILGFNVYKKLFSNSSPLNQVIRMNIAEGHMTCKIIGVFSEKGSQKENNEILVPYTFYQRSLQGLFWLTKIHKIMIALLPSVNSQKIGDALVSFFKDKYGDTGEFELYINSAILEQTKKSLFLLSLLMAIMSMIILVVGGMGVCNMMLVSVSERLREIGIRKAVGATNKHIKILFILESFFICFFAGIIGLLLGPLIYLSCIWIATQFISTLAFEWFFSPIAFILAFFSTILVGIFSGLFPAIKAEKLQILEALKSE